MIKISTVVERIIENDESALSALNAGILNIPDYAFKIKPLVDNELLKDVSAKSIAMALYRLRNKSVNDEIKITLKTITVSKNLSLVTYDRSSFLHKELPALADDKFCSITMGVHELTFIGDTEYISNITKRYELASIYNMSDLSAVSVSFDPKYIESPNLLYKLIQRLSLHNVNIIEIVSTSTELTFIVKSQDITRTVDLLGKYLS